MAKYRLLKETSGDGKVRYSIQKKKLFYWKEVDYEYSEQSAFNTFNKFAIKPKIEILKEAQI